MYDYYTPLFKQAAPPDKFSHIMGKRATSMKLTRTQVHLAYIYEHVFRISSTQPYH